MHEDKIRVRKSKLYKKYKKRDYYCTIIKLKTFEKFLTIQ
jgi:hypothetical protein